MKVKKLVLTAVMTALSVVLNELLVISIPPTASPLMRLSLGVIPIFVIAYYCGIFYAIVAGTLTDILGFFVFGMAKGYAFNLGYTLNAFLSGAIIGFFILIRKFMSTRKGLLTLIITDVALTVISCGLYFYMAMTQDIIKNTDSKLAIAITVTSISIIVNIIVIVYAIVARENKDSNAIIMAFIVYQYVVSLCLTPLWLTIMYHTNYFVYWTVRMVTVPLQIMIYALISKVVVYATDKFTLLRKKEEVETNN